MIVSLYDQFHSAILSNAQLYTVYKLCSLARTFILYRTMTSHDFNTWALLQSTIYLLLLWLGCGVQQAIARYGLYFASHRNLLKYLLLAQMILIGLGIPIIFLIHQSTPFIIILLAIGVYLTEAGYSVLESLYHASFNNRSFNNRAISANLIETSFTILILYVINPEYLLISLLSLKLLSGIAFNALSAAQWTTIQPIATPTKQLPQAGQIIKYSLYNWLRTVLSTMTQRNFLIHIITGAVGVEGGNIFKVASDGARYFHRTIIKTIGTADTALLSHLEGYNDGSGKDMLLMREGIEKLSTQVSRLALPLLGIVGVLTLWFHIVPYYDTIVFHSFLIMTVGFIGETIFLPYRRMLEIRREYITILRSYIPYICIITLLFILITYAYIGLITFLICIHSVRLVIGLIIRIHAYIHYGM